MLRGVLAEPRRVRRIGVRARRQDVLRAHANDRLAGRRHPQRDAAGHRHHAGSQRSALAGEAAGSAKGTQDRGRWQITHTDWRYVRMGGALLLRRWRDCGLRVSRRSARLGRLRTAPPWPLPQLKGISARAGRRITTVTHRDVRSGGVRDQPAGSADAVRRPARGRRRRARRRRCSRRKRHRGRRGGRASDSAPTVRALRACVSG